MMSHPGVENGDTESHFFSVKMIVDQDWSSLRGQKSLWLRVCLLLTT